MPRLTLLAALFVLPVALAAQEAPVPDTLYTLSADEIPATEAPEPEPAMTLERLDAVIRALDPEAQGNGKVWQFTIDGVQVLVVTDARADRMRAIAPVARSAEVTPEQMTRMMQANFDSALDARYAIARDVLWSAYIHPLAALQKDQLISGIGQVVNLVQSFGTLYSSGGLLFGGGDSGALQRALIDELLKKGEEI
ncbi:type III secretion system chaperone [Roseovarius ramblicola]|uniref:Type III secretion system chaperone n=1 Tax=Roseovarius ramblicola TaxID=2022336 RepID=A0ABV5HYV9_9RHOB